MRCWPCIELWCSTMYVWFISISFKSGKHENKIPGQEKSGNLKKVGQFQRKIREFNER